MANGGSETRPYERDAQSVESLFSTTHASKSVAGAPSELEHRFRPGTRIGRYTVEDTIGAGGMGLVLRAHDPTLERPVAVKLVRFRGDDPAADADRLIAEARALARLDHPNIIEVFDAGMYEFPDADSQTAEASRALVFIAMEYFEGWSLHEHLTIKKPDVDAIMGIVERLAEALNAAHRAGVVHRDIKPKNVLVDEQGRVKVVDFGLARTMAVPDHDTDSGSVATPSSLDHERYSHASGLVGTLPYLAPELLEGGQPSSGSDAWALGVTLFEALHGRRPFSGKTPVALAVRMEEGAKIRRDLPRPLRRMVSGLLHPVPQKRPSMAAVAAAARRFRTRRSRRRVAVAAGVLVAGSAVLGGSVSSRRACSADDSAVAQLWTAARQQEIAAVMRASEAPFADKAWAELQPVLDRRVQRWGQLHRSACASDRAADQPVLECLDRQRAGFEAVLASVSNPTATLLEDTSGVAERIPQPDDCADPRGLAWQPPLPDDSQARTRAASLRAEIAALALLHAAGRMTEAEQAARALLDEARDLGDPAVEGELYLEMGRLLSTAARHQEAEEVLRRARRLGLDPNYPRLRAEAALALADELGTRQRRFVEAREVLRSAADVVEVLDHDDFTQRLWLSRARLALADEQFLEARQLYEELLGLPSSAALRRDDLLHGLAATWVGSGRPILAEQVLHEALALRMARLGEIHPDVADSQMLLGSVLMHQGRIEESERAFLSARAIRSTLFGEDSSPVVEIDASLGALALHAGDPRDAARRFETVVARIRNDPNRVDFDVSGVHSRLGVAYARLGRFEAAIEQQKKALELIAIAAGPHHPQAALPTVNMAAAYRRIGDLDAAIEWTRKAIELTRFPGQRLTLRSELAELLRHQGRVSEATEIWKDVLRSDLATYPAVELDARRGMAELELDRGLFDLATMQEILDRAEELHTDEPTRLATYRFAWARSLWLAGDRRQALAAAESARSVAQPSTSEARRIQAWIERPSSLPTADATRPSRR